MKIRIYAPISGAVKGEIATNADGRLAYMPGTLSVGQLLGIVEELRPYLDDDTGEIKERTDAEVVASLPARLRNQTEWAEVVAE